MAFFRVLTMKTCLTTIIAIFLLKIVATEDILNKCISSKKHKTLPGPEGRALSAFHCQAWNNHSCCTWNTTSSIDKDGTLSLYNMLWDQCPQKKNMSEKCKRHFEKDTCFYECSPNLGPWIEVDPISKVTRKERVVNVPICASDCDQWYHDCMFDYTCNDNWGMNWNWKKKGTTDMCPKSCKTFREYFSGPKKFCELIFNHSLKYETDKNKCMNLSPVGSKNANVARQKAAEMYGKSSSVVVKWDTVGLFACFYLFSNIVL